jgi:hypothetical protein
MPSRIPYRTKKCGELPPHSTRGTITAQRT